MLTKGYATLETRKEFEVEYKLIAFAVLLLEGNSEYFAHRLRIIGLFGFLNIGFVTALDLMKCLEQMNYQRLLLRCAPIS